MKTTTRIRPIRRLKLIARALRQRATGQLPSTEDVTRANTRQAYEMLYGDARLLGEYLSPARLTFFREIAGFCAFLRPARVLDLGCGSGHVLQALAAEWKLRHLEPSPVLYGLDYAWSAVVRARELVPEGHFSLGAIYQAGYADAAFDLVISTETFEHLHHPDQALAEVFRLCRPAGYVLITVPDGELDDWEGHVNFWTVTTLRQFLGRLLHVQDLRRVDEGRVLLALTRKQP